MNKKLEIPIIDLECQIKMLRKAFKTKDKETIITEAICIKDSSEWILNIFKVKSE